MTFEFATAARIIFGRGASAGIGTLAAGLGRRALIVTGRSPARTEHLVARVREAGVSTIPFGVDGEPDTSAVEAGAAVARASACDLVIGLGGGSALDTAKAIAALAANAGSLLDYLEVVGRGQPLERAPFPCLAVPTTAGTGSEVTRNAVLTARAQRVKVSLRSVSMLPRIALVDPELTMTVPAAVTATTGLDALTQLIEPYLSSRANALTDALCREGIGRARGALGRAVADGSDEDARQDMALASLCGGLALANAGLGAVHGLAGPIGGWCEAPHGAVCAALLPHVMAGNLKAIEARGASEAARRRFDEVACLLTDRPGACARDAVGWLRQLSSDLRVAPLRHYGLTPDDLPAIADRALRASSMKANPVALSRDELIGILAAAR